MRKEVTCRSLGCCFSFPPPWPQKTHRGVEQLPLHLHRLCSARRGGPRALYSLEQVIREDSGCVGQIQAKSPTCARLRSVEPEWEYGVAGVRLIFGRAVGAVGKRSCSGLGGSVGGSKRRKKGPPWACSQRRLWECTQRRERAPCLRLRGRRMAVTLEGPDKRTAKSHDRCDSPSARASGGRAEQHGEIQCRIDGPVRTRETSPLVAEKNGHFAPGGLLEYLHRK